MTKFRLSALLALLLLTACATPPPPYTPPASGPVAQLNSTGTMAIGGNRPVGITVVREDISCNSLGYVRGDQSIAIPAGRPIIIERSHSSYSPFFNSSGGCGVAMRFVPREGETYEARLTLGRDQCVGTILRVDAQGRTEAVGIEKVLPAECRK